MKLPEFKSDWPKDWKESYVYDKLEFFNDKSNLGYTNSYKNRFNAIIANVKQYLPIGSTLIDVAAAQGNFTLSLAEAKYKMIWNDLRESLIDYVKLKYIDGSIEFKSGNVFDIKLPEADGIIITEIIEHVAHPNEFLKKVSTLIKNQGYIFMTTPIGSYFINKLPKFSDCPDPSIYESVQFKPNSDGHIFLLHLEEIEKFAKESGLEIVKVEIFNNPLTNGHIKLHYLLKILPQRFIDFIEKQTKNLPFALKKKLNSHVLVVFKKV